MMADLDQHKKGGGRSRGRASSRRARCRDTCQRGGGPVLGYDTETDIGSMSAISRITGAQSMWSRGFSGQGVDVALIDTGVARVAGLHHAGKVIDAADLSFDSQDSSLGHVDAFGHGTHMAGIIGGTDVAPGVGAAQLLDVSGEEPLQ
jgi:subtilisin family serine protease